MPPRFLLARAFNSLAPRIRLRRRQIFLAALASLLVHQAPTALRAQDAEAAAYPYFDGSVPLRAEREFVALRVRPARPGEPADMMQRARESAASLPVDAASLRPLTRDVVLARARAGTSAERVRSTWRDRARAAAATQAAGAPASAQSRITSVAPVYRPPSGNLWIATHQIIVKLRPEDAAAGRRPFAADRRFLAQRPVPGTPDQFVLSLAADQAGEPALAIA
jgi:hypothetical protein